MFVKCVYIALVAVLHIVLGDEVQSGSRTGYAVGVLRALSPR